MFPKNFQTVRNVAILLTLPCLCTLSAHAAPTQTLLAMESAPGEFVGAGQSHYYTEQDGTFKASVHYSNGVSISFMGFAPGIFSHLDFDAPYSNPISKGSYSNAPRWPFNGDAAGLSVGVNGAGCNQSLGSFHVSNISYGTDNLGNPTVESFAADFTQSCLSFSGQLSPGLTGTIYFNAPAKGGSKGKGGGKGKK